MNKEQRRYLKEIKAMLPVFGKHEKRFFSDIRESVKELGLQEATYELLCIELGRPEDLIANYYQNIDSLYLRKQLRYSKLIKTVSFIILIAIVGLVIFRMTLLYDLYLEGKDAVITHEVVVIE